VLLFNHKWAFKLYTFKEEKEQKINFIERLRNHKDILKKNKFKKTELEADLAYSSSISLTTFFAMCAIEGINIAVLKNHCLYTLISNESSNIELLQMKDNRYGYLILEKKEKQHKFNEFVTKYWRIDNLAKPLAGQSSYKLGQLQEIANKLI
jgi:hypothetical protein